MLNLRSVMNLHFNKEINNSKDVALLFSGGTDSLTCLFSLLDIGVRPALYSFHLEDTIHKDIEVSKLVAEHYKLVHQIIEIERDINQLKMDVKYIIEKFKVTRKTNVQCTYPFLHVLPQIKEKYVVSGLCADDLYGTAKSVAIKGGKDKNKLDEIRMKTLSNLDSSAYRPIKELVENVYGKKFIAPYRSKEVIDHLLQFSWEEMNKPKQKQIAYTAYIDYFEKQSIYRRNTNLQVGSKIREWHSELVDTDLNENNRHRVDEIYKDLGEGIDKVKLEESNWKFDESVVPVFDEHVKQSVPMYDEIHSLVADISGWFLEDNTNVYDIGTSTGKVISSLLDKYSSKDIKYIGLDNSIDMYEKAKETFKSIHNVNIENIDATKDYIFENASLITSILTLQFVPERLRQDLINNIHRGLNKGSAFIMVEKVVGSNARFNEIWIDLYHELKLKNGLTEEHVFSKARAIRGVMKPYTVSENIHMLESAGFKDVDMFFKWNNFVGFIAIK